MMEDYMSNVTYYARFSDCGDDGICVTFPDLHGGYLSTCGDTKDEAIEAAKSILKAELDMEGMDDCVFVMYPPSPLEDLKAEADDPKWHYLIEEGGEINREFVPISITPPSNAYKKRLRPHPRNIKK
jgi:hypothetical protein